MRILSAFAALALCFPASAQVLTRLQTSAAPVPGYTVPALAAPSGLPAPVLSLSLPSLAPALAAPAAALPAPVAVAAALSPSAVPASPERPNPLGQLRAALVDWLKPGVSAEDASAAAPVSAYVLDLDGNAFGSGFPTKIILFRKGGNEELPVPTAHFAVIEKSIGTDFTYGGANLKDYELRGDASFREFFGPKFAADLRYAVENLPAAEWQGPSWPALVRALNDPVLAAHTYVLTARQHTSEQLLDGFRYLQAAGFIRYLPKVENLHGVGGTRRTAERKAELMAEFIDALQAAPLGGGRHAIGFSDDTWANYEKMRDALTGILKREPGRWSKVKIVLFFTGSNDLSHGPEAIVLEGDGSTRPYIPGEPR